MSIFLIFFSPATNSFQRSTDSLFIHLYQNTNDNESMANGYMYALCTYKNYICICVKSEYSFVVVQITYLFSTILVHLCSTVQ